LSEESGHSSSNVKALDKDELSERNQEACSHEGLEVPRRKYEGAGKFKPTFEFRLAQKLNSINLPHHTRLELLQCIIVGHHSPANQEYDMSAFEESGIGSENGT